MSTWFPAFNRRGEIASGNGRILVGDRDIGEGYSPQWLDDDTLLATNPTQLVDTRTGVPTVLPFVFSGRIGNVPGISAGAGHWCGFAPNVGLIANGVTVDAAAAPGSIDRTNGRLAYLTPYQAEPDHQRDVVIAGVRVRRSVATEIRAADDAVVWGEYEHGVRKLWGWSQALGVTRLSPMGAQEAEYTAVPVATPAGLWLVAGTHRGLIVFPWGGHDGYVLEGEYFYHDALWLENEIRIVATTQHGVGVMDRVDLSQPRRDLSSYRPTTGPVDPDPVGPPTCTITAFPSSVGVGDPATVTAALGGGPAERLIWRQRAMGETAWRIAAVQSPPMASHAYVFHDPGLYAIGVRVEGPGGSDETGVPRVIEVVATPTDPDPDPAVVKVAFGPTPAAPGMLQLFTEDETWAEARKHTSVFHFHLGQIFSFENVGPNTYQNLVDAQAFRKLKAWGIFVELGTDHGVDDTVRAAEMIAAAGGELTFVAHDRGFHELSADDVAALLRGTRERVPSVKAVGLYAAFPFKTIEQIRTRLVELDERGARPDFLRMDVDPGQFEKLTPAAFRAFRDMCDDRQIALQYVVNAPDNMTDADYVTRAKAKFAYTQPLGKWDGLIVESWARRGELFVLPKAGPESDASSQAALLLHVARNL